MILGIILGGVAAYYFTKFAKKWGTTILGAMTGAILTVMIISPMVKNNNGLVIGLLVLDAVIGGFVGFKFNRYVRVYSTSIIGAGLLAIGVNSFLGGLPDLLNLG